MVHFGVEGNAPGMKSSLEVGEDYLGDRNYTDNDARVRSLIRWHVARTGTTGFLTGLGGLIVLPATLPAGLGASWIFQARMVGAIAHIRGYGLDDDRVRTLPLASMAGDATVKEALKEMGGQAAIRGAKAAAMRIPGKVLIDINKQVGFRLLTKSGSKAVVNITKLVPIAGGVVGGVVDGAATRAVGGVAQRAFPQRTPHQQESPDSTTALSV